MISPPYLVPGDSIAIIATARKVSEEEMKPAIEILEKAGLTVELGGNIFNKENQYSGSDEERLNDLQWALDDETIKAVIIARGGYGTVRLIDKVDFSLFQKNPKWIIGYSDVTVLHSHINAHFQTATLHATMPINFLKNEEATQSLLNALQGKLNSYSFEPHSLNRNGKAEGVLVGGNLSLLYALAASPSDINTNGKILFIEDLDEYYYHIDRMMINLKRSGKLKDLKGLIVGGMTEMKDNAIPFGKNSEEIILDSVKEYDYPVCFNFPAGHVDRNLAFYLGKKCELNVTNSDSSIVFFEK
ncbi:MAG: LD-carboxypeptidase [Bacteroidia bacterium]|nr:LD-carboxypeptidase [Bacteroidia bacterium]